MGDKVFQVVIVGAGISGLSAANYLLANGITDILILEAKSKPGGRVATHHISATEKVELGAGWIHGEENDFCKLVNASGHLHPKTSWEGKGDFLLPNGEKADPSTVSEILEWLENTIGYVEDTFSIEELQSNPNQIGNKPHLSSMGSFLRDRFKKYIQDMGIDEASEEFMLKDAIFQWGMSFQRIDNSCNQMTNLSLFRWSEFQVNGGELYNNFKHGASAFVDGVLVKKLPLGLILCDSPVENISWNGNGNDFVQIKLRDGRVYKTLIVLVTCSIGVLKRDQEQMFTPHLPPNLKNAINATGFGPIGKVYLRWEKPWWPENLEGYQLLWPNEYINCCDDNTDDPFPNDEIMKERWMKSFTGFDPVLDCPNVLLGWLGGPEAKFIEKLSEKEVGEGCAKILGSFTGCQVPMPDRVVISKWSTDEFVAGAYCHRSTEGDKVYGDITAALAKPVVKLDREGREHPVILLAGEALSKKHYSTIHGAFETGESQAAKIVEHFKSQKLAAALNTVICKKNGLLHNFAETCEVPKDSNNMGEKMEIDVQDINDKTDLLVCQFSQQLNVRT